MNVNNAIGVNENLVGVEVKNIQDVVKAQAAGLIITDEIGCRFNYFVMNEETGEEREAKEQEIFDQITAALAEGEKVFACIEIMDGLHVAKKKTNTNLRSEFYVHQHVYTMHENKMIEGEIVYLSLAYGRLGDDAADALYGNMAEQLYYDIGYYFTNGRTPKIGFQREEIINKISSLKMHAHVVLKTEEGDYLTRDIEEIFATKQGLVDNLMQD